MRHHHHFDCSTYAGQTASDDPVQSMDNYQRPCRIDGSSMTRNPSKVADESPAKRQIESTFDGPSGPEDLGRPLIHLRSKATSRRCPKLTGLMTMRPALSRRPKIVGRRDSDSTPDTMPRGSWNRFQHFVSLSIHASISFSNQPTARLRGAPKFERLRKFPYPSTSEKSTSLETGSIQNFRQPQNAIAHHTYPFTHGRELARCD